MKTDYYKHYNKIKNKISWENRDAKGETYLWRLQETCRKQYLNGVIKNKYKFAVWKMCGRYARQKKEHV